MKNSILGFLLLSTSAVIGQNVGIGSTSFTPNDDALLELRSTTSGFLLPKMTEAQKNAIVGPTEGLIVYQTNSGKGFKYYNGSIWTEFGVDNFGDHIAGQNIELDGNWLSNDGGDEGIRISDDGNVGIGTATPAQRLQVQVSNSSGMSFPLLVRNSGATNGTGTGSGIGFNNHNAGNDVKTAIYNERVTDFGVGKLHFLMSNTSNTTPVTLADAKMTILSGGNIGIGVTSPAARLHTVGTTRMEGLSGTGTRMVVADASGNLSTQALPSSGSTPTTVVSTSNQNITSASYTSVSGMSISGVSAGTYLVNFNADIDRNGSSSCNCIVRAGGSDESDTERTFQLSSSGVSQYHLMGKVTLASTGTIEIRCKKIPGGSGITVENRAMSIQATN